MKKQHDFLFIYIFTYFFICLLTYLFYLTRYLQSIKRIVHRLHAFLIKQRFVFHSTSICLTFHKLNFKSCLVFLIHISIIIVRHFFYLPYLRLCVRPTISFIIFYDFSMFCQIFLSPQVKRWAILTYKHCIYELPHELPKEN